ncbi:MAG: hypothetical protein KGI07_09770 [Thaumarchaeota archaeon]|nr:hypothetical protein [Nitrososphaerota archaeon]
MLSKRERDFILNSKSFSKHYAAQMRYNLKKKLTKVTDDLNLIIANCISAGISIEPLKSLKAYSIPEAKKQKESQPIIDNDDGWS